MTVIFGASGDLLADLDGAIPVIATNCIGVMGAGIAGQYAKRDPRGYAHYRARCRAGEHRLGVPVLVRGELGLALCFPTMHRPGSRAEITDLREGLRAFRLQLAAHPELAGSTWRIPRLGCGIGRLSWIAVARELQSQLHGIPDHHFIVYGPAA